MQNLLPNYKVETELEQKDIRSGFGKGIVAAVERNNQVIALNADLPGSLKLEELMEKHPANYVQVGVAEQNMAGIATGLERVGKVPFITSFAAFNPGLNYSQIRLAVMGGQNIKVVGSHYGLNIGSDGKSAQMNSDVAMMKALEGMTVINPADYNQALAATLAIAATKDPAYLRVTRVKLPVFIAPDAPFEIGKIQKLLDGSDITIAATGSMVYEAMQAALLLEEQGVKVDLLNVHTIKPLDKEAIISSVSKTGKIVVVEEHNMWGGLGESIARILGEHKPTPLRIVAINDVFGESAYGHRELWQKYGLDRQNIVQKAKELL